MYPNIRDGDSIRMQEKTINLKLFNISSMVIISGLAFFVRFYNIGLFPINHDEAHFARFLLINPEFIKKFIGIPVTLFFNISYNLLSFLSTFITSLRVFNLNEFIFHMRFQPVIVGTLTVLLVYLLAKQMYGRKAAVISSLLLCFLPWHIVHSRIMGRVIWVPFYGCLIFLTLLKAVQAKNKVWAGAWFLVSCFFLKESLNTYESAILFIPVFFISLICLWKEIGWQGKLGVILPAMAVLFALLPFVSRIAVWGNEFWQYFYRGYQKNIFEGHLLFNLWENVRANLGFAFKDLFFNFEGSYLLYGKALKAPLLIHPVTLFLFTGSLIFSLCQRKAADKILLAWLFLGFLGGIAGVDLFQPRYILIALPAFVIFIGKFIAGFFVHLSKKFSLKREFLLITGIVLCLWLVTAGVTQWLGYYYTAPFNLEECRCNSYGCKEAGEYLSRIPDLKNYSIVTDSRMTVDVYLSYYLLNKGKIDKYYDFRHYFMPDKNEKKEKGEIYVLWAPESHPKDYWNGLFRYLYDFFRQKYPDKEPIKTIYYSNGLAAIHIFKAK